MPQGRIKIIYGDKGFGFISVCGGRDVFFHALSVEEARFEALETGQSVEFELEAAGEEKGKGPRARSVKPLSKIAAALLAVFEGS